MYRSEGEGCVEMGLRSWRDLSKFDLSRDPLCFRCIFWRRSLSASSLSRHHTCVNFHRVPHQNMTTPSVAIWRIMASVSPSHSGSCARHRSSIRPPLWRLVRVMAVSYLSIRHQKWFSSLSSWPYTSLPTVCSATRIRLSATVVSHGRRRSGYSEL